MVGIDDLAGLGEEDIIEIVTKPEATIDKNHRISNSKDGWYVDKVAGYVKRYNTDDVEISLFSNCDDYSLKIKYEVIKEINIK